MRHQLFNVLYVLAMAATIVWQSTTWPVAGDVAGNPTVFPRALAATFPGLEEVARLGRVATRPVYLVARKEDLRVLRVRTAFDVIARELGAYVERYG